MASNSEAVRRAWKTRRAKYGDSGCRDINRVKTCVSAAADRKRKAIGDLKVGELASRGER